MQAHILSNLCHIQFKQKIYSEAKALLEEGLPLALENGDIRLSKYFILKKASLSLVTENPTEYIQDVLAINQFSKDKGYQYLESETLSLIKKIWRNIFTQKSHENSIYKQSPKLEDITLNEVRIKKAPSEPYIRSPDPQIGDWILIIKRIWRNF